MKLVREHINEEEKPFKYFKGKSEEEIEKSLEGLSLEQKFKKAVRNNLPKIVEQCINDGYDPSEHNQWAINWAIEDRLIDVIKILIKDKRVKFEENDSYPIGLAADRGDYEIVKLLLDNELGNINLPSYGTNAIQDAMRTDQINILKLFLNHPFSRKQLSIGDKEFIEEYIREYSDKVNEGVADVYAEKEFYIPQETFHLNDKENIIGYLNKPIFGKLNDYYKIDIIKNPIYLDSFKNGTRAVILRNGDIYVADLSNTSSIFISHWDILNKLYDLKIVKDKNYNDWESLYPGYNKDFICIQKINTKYRIAESYIATTTINKNEIIKYFNLFFNLCSIKNPDFTYCNDKEIADDLYLNEGVADKYSSKEFYIEEPFSNFENKFKETLIEKDKIIGNITECDPTTYTKKCLIIKNPTSLSNFAPNCRGVITKTGDLYIASANYYMHDPIIDFLDFKEIIEYNGHWHKINEYSEYITVQRYNLSNKIALGESNFLPKLKHNLDIIEHILNKFYKPFLDKCKSKNPNFEFILQKVNYLDD